MALAGFTSSEAEGLRRAMSRKRSEAGDRRAPPALPRRRRRATASPRRAAEQVWEQIQGFSGFGFPKAHSAAFGLLAYQSAWLRSTAAPEFLCSLLNEQPMGFYPPDSLVHEAQRRGIRVAPPDANRSQRPLPRRIAARDAELRGGWWCGSGSATSRGCARRRWRRWSPSASAAGPTAGSPTSPRARGAGLREPGTAGLGGGARRDPGRRGGRAPRGALAGRRRRRRARRRRRRPSWRCRWSRRRRRRWSRWASGAS